MKVIPEAACLVCQDWPWPVVVSDYSTVVVEVVAVVEGS